MKKVSLCVCASQVDVDLLAKYMKDNWIHPEEGTGLDEQDDEEEMMMMVVVAVG